MSKIIDLAYVKATELNRGKASACLKNVHDNDCDTVVVKNSEPYAVIISVEKYQSLINDQEQLVRLSKYVKNIDIDKQER